MILQHLKLPQDHQIQTSYLTLPTDFLEIINSCCEQKLDNLKIEWREKKSLCIVVCSKGYPEKFQNNVKINNLEKLNMNKNDYIFHAGTKKINGNIFSNGGRVLNFVSISSNYKESREKVLKLINNLNWSNSFFRKDIGFKVIDK